MAITKSVSYCLFGSKKHLMNELFEKKSLPFYKFGDAIYLPKIGTSDWVDYICSRFEATGKQISKDLAERICQIVDNHSSYVQQWHGWYGYTRIERLPSRILKRHIKILSTRTPHCLKNRPRALPPIR